MKLVLSDQVWALKIFLKSGLVIQWSLSTQKKPIGATIVSASQQVRVRHHRQFTHYSAGGVASTCRLQQAVASSPGSAWAEREPGTH